MNQSLSMMFVLEGGYPRTYLSVQDNYQSPAQVFNAPLEFIDFSALVDSARSPGEYLIVSTSPDNPDFQIESNVVVRHHDGEISWDIIFEHYEPFLSLELSPEADDFDENIVSFTFDAFQYVSTLYQACLSSSHIPPVSFTANNDKQSADTDKENTEESATHYLHQYTQRLNILWQKHGTKNNMVTNGQATKTSDHFAHEAEKEWLQDIIDTLDDVHNDNVMENLDAYLESLPEDALSRLEKNRDQLQETLTQRWELLVNSLTKEEADALENDQVSTLYPNSLKLRLISEFIDGNPAVLLGSSHNQHSSSETVVDLRSWKHHAKKPDLGK
ncbi:MAG: Unknown protein [uncultured Thiotrichaceae bacterium]|uniref:Uncharacterized protein n=1 Tax=uncultured Thiotrichaceae bacterium TaxID=298394 RepID=A0A6S6SF80_9GAMM|nr:MAG: Unknown protein [uncultured Thiotrichaceae bacterium]